MQREIPTKSALGHLDSHRRVEVRLGRPPLNETPPMRNQHDPLWTFRREVAKVRKGAAYGGVNEVQEVTRVVLLVEHTGTGQCI